MRVTSISGLISDLMKNYKWILDHIFRMEPCSCKFASMAWENTLCKLLWPKDKSQSSGFGLAIPQINILPRFVEKYSCDILEKSNTSLPLLIQVANWKWETQRDCVEIQNSSFLKNKNPSACLTFFVPSAFRPCGTRKDDFLSINLNHWFALIKR